MKKRIFIIALFLFLIGITAGCNLGSLGGNSGDDSEQRDIYDSAKNDTSSYEAWLNSVKGANGREIEMSVVQGVVVWHYVGDSAWIPLFSIDDINGSNGVNGINGTNGTDGREVEIRFFNNVLQWHYTNENEWSDLFNTQALKGEAGNNGIGISSIQKVKTEGLIDTYAINFSDGTMTTFTVVNGVQGEKGEKGDKGDKGDQGEQGNSIKSITKIETNDLVDTYLITFSDDTTTTFTVTNGLQGEKGSGIEKIEIKESPNAFLDIYTIFFDDGSTFDFEVRHGEPLDERKFNVTFDSDGGTEVENQEVQFGYKAIAPEDPVKEGYKFLGWYVGEERWIFVGYFVTENINLVARWELATYDITYNYNGGEEVEDAPTSFTMLDNDIALPVPERLGYTFLGWCDSEELINPEMVIRSGSTGNKELFAKWEANHHTITFESNGGTQYEERGFTYEESVVLPTPERTGYQFLYWSAEENMQHAYEGKFDEDEDLTLYARWMVNGNAQYKVLVYKQNLDGSYSMTPSETLTYDATPETTVTAPQNYYQGFDYPNYYPSGLVVSDGSLKLKVFYPRGTYQISVYDGNKWNYYNFKYEEKVELPEPTKIGYVFTGWNRQIPEKMPSYNFNVEPTWQGILYKVTFDCNGGEALDRAELMYGQQVNLPTPTFEGYEFAGWYCNGKKIENGSSWSYLEDVTLVANWATLSNDFVFAQVEDHLELISYSGNDTEITVPTTADGVLVKGIASNAFKDNETIQKIILQDGITTIGDSAFAGMTALKEITLPGTVTSYGSDLLTGSNSLEKITIASNFNKQLRYLFGNNIANVPASLVKIKYATGCTEVNNTMWQVEKLKNEGDPIVLELADDWTNVPYSAFQSCNGITSVIIPEGIQYIYSNAFDRCQKITSVVLPISLLNIYEYAFRQCTLLSSINLQDCSSLTNIGYEAFYECDSIVEITLPENLTTLQSESFAYMDNLERVNFNNKLQGINNNCFYNCQKLDNIELPASVNYIYGNAFSYCTNLTSVIIHKGINQMNGYVFQNCYSTTIFCEEDSKPAGWNSDWAINGPTVVWGFKEKQTFDGYICAINNSDEAIILGVEDLTKTSYEFPEKVGAYDVIDINLPAIFKNNTTVEEVYIPDCITSIPGSCFYGCTALKKVIFGENTAVTSIGSSAFYNCTSLTSIRIPDGVSYINNSTFYNCNNLSVVILPVSVTYLYSQAFYNVYNITKVFYSGTIDDRNNISREYSNDGLFNAAWEYESDVKNITIASTEDFEYIAYDNGEATITKIINSKLTSFDFEDTVDGYTIVELGANLFNNNDKLTSVTLPSGLKKIGNYAFYDCDKLTEVVLPDSVEEIGSYAFQSCERLATVTGAKNLKEVKSYAFCDNNQLQSFTGPEAVEYIRSRAFSNCTSMTNIFTLDYVKEIGESSFNWSYNLFTTLNLKSIEYIGPYAFNYSNQLTTVILGNNLTQIDYYAFQDCYNLVTLYIPASVTTVGARILNDVTSEYLTIYCGIDSEPDDWDGNWNINDSTVVWGCDDITTTDNAAYLTKEDEYVTLLAYFDKGAKVFTINEEIANVNEIGRYAFYRIKNVRKILIPETVTTISQYAFYSSRTRVDMLCAASSQPGNWNYNWCNGDFGIYWSSDLSREILEITVTSSDQNIVWDGNWHNVTAEVIVNGTLADGDTFNWYNNNSRYDVGTYEATFNYDITHQVDQNIDDVTRYYIVNRGYGTLTITPQE